MRDLLPRHITSFFKCAALSIAALFILGGCASSQRYIEKEYEAWSIADPPLTFSRLHRVFLVGNTGEMADDYPALTLLQQLVDRAGTNSTTIFLGDQVPCCGLPDSGHADRPPIEAHLRQQLDAVKDAPGNVFFVAGDQDWNGQRGSLNLRKNQELFIEQYLGRGNVFLPDNGFPGPEIIDLGKNLHLMLLDTQWWLSEGEKAFGDTGDYDLQEASDFLREMQEKLYKYRNDKLLIVGHHPFYTNGEHGGNFPTRTHLSPLPIFGSLEPFYRRYVGNRQDLAHQAYRLLRTELNKLFEEKELVYAAAHDQSLQYFPKGTNRARRHFLVSGSGTKASYVASGRGAGYTAAHPGFLVLDYYEDNSIWLTAWETTPASPEGVVTFRYPIQPAAPAPIPDDAVLAREDLPDYADSTIVVAANAT
ncbi:MAG: hypothetical protein AAF564_21875, partial [Bacteroidota bacterium]